MLRAGSLGFAVAYAGFLPVRSYAGERNLLGQTMRLKCMNVADALAAAATLAMGEGSERTPIAVISDPPNVVFLSDDGKGRETDTFSYKPEDDLYGPLWAGDSWRTN